MDPPARVAYVGDPARREAIERELGGRVTLTSVDPRAVAQSEADCVLCIESLPEELDREGRPPTLLVTADESATKEARLAGMRVLPMAVSEQPDALLAQIEAAASEARTRSGAVDGRLASALIDTVTDVVYAFDETGFSYWNDRLPAMTGINDEELASVHPVDLFCGKDADRIAAAIDRCEPTNLPITIEADLPGPDGRSTPYEFTNSRLVDGGETVGICGVGRDVTEYKRTTWTLEQLLEATRDLMAAESEEEVATVAVSAANHVLGLSHTGIHLVDDDGERLEPIAYTDRVEASLGTVPTLERGESLAWGVFESGVDQVYEGVHEQAGAHNPETHLQSELIFSLGDHGVILIASQDPEAFDDADVSFAKLLAATTTGALDRAARESALEHKNTQLEEFVGVVSHDLRNPLTVAEGSVSLARETGDDSHLDGASDSHRRMREIIEGLLVLAREGRAVGETRPVIVGTVAEEAWTNVDTDDASLTIGDNRTVHADRNRLTQLFENAFRNSVEHGSTSSRPEADDSVEHSSTGNRNAKRSGDSVEHIDSGVTVTVTATPNGFAISDDGPGIPDTKRQTVLESDFDTENETGFGMTIMRNIADGHGWELSLAESDAGGLRIEITTDADETDHSGGER